MLLADTLPADAPRELGAMLNVHSLLLGDPLLAEQTLALIAERHYNAEWALTTQGQILGQQFDAMEDEYLRERGADVRQVMNACCTCWPAHPPCCRTWVMWTATKP